MTLWNPLNVFVNPKRRSAGNEAAASFDPSRTGDPVVPSCDRPAIGFGETGSGAPSGGGDSRRHPVGFAPWDEEQPQRYVTEFSFKRYHEMPRASVTPDSPVGDSQEPWQTPETGLADDPVDMSGESASDEVVEAKVPFSKRQIGFRRKSTPSRESADLAEKVGEGIATAPSEEVRADLSAEADIGAEVEPELAAQLGSVPFEHADVELPGEAVEPSAGETRETNVPFYKREISFRRKHAPAVGEVADEPRSTDELLSEDDHGREETVETVVPDEIIVAEVVTAEVVASSEETTEPLVEKVDVLEVEADTAVDVELVAVQRVDVDVHDVEQSALVATADDAELVPVGAGDDVPEPEASSDLPESEASSELDDLFIEDTPPSKGRFSSRKSRSTEKAPKRTAARGGGPKGRRVVGLKIGASQIAAAVVVETDGRHELVNLARRPLAAGIVVDGEIRDIDALSNALKSFFEKEKLPRKGVRIGLASNRIGVRTFDIVGIDDEARFDNAVRFKAHEVLPVAAHESVLDYRVLKERPNEAGEPTRRVLLVVAPNDQVEPYAEVARRVGIKLSGIDLEALGLLRAFVEPKPLAVRAVDDTATVVVSIGHASSTLLVAGGGACEFTRVFDWGGGALVEAIATTLDVRPAEAETILKHLSLSGPGRQLDGLDEMSRAKALDAVRLRLTPFARELVSSLQFYQTQDESLGIGGIVITGGTSHLEGLGEALHQMIGVDVSVGDPLARVSVANELDPAIEALIGSMAVPIGLAIDDIAMRSVDLLPKGAGKTKSKRSTLIAIGAPIAASVPLIALGAMYLGAHGKAADSQAELAAVKAEIAALPATTGPTIDTAVVGDEAVRATAVASVLGGRLAWDSVFRDMARVFPTNVWLTALSASLPQTTNLADATTAPVAAATPGAAEAVPTAVVIEGYTYTQPDVARLLARLVTLPSLKRVTLTSSQQELVGKKEVVRFVIVADLSTTGGAS